MNDYIYEVELVKKRMTMRVYEDHIEMAAKRSIKTYYFSDITSIEFKNCGRTAGYFEFIIPGGQGNTLATLGGWANTDRYIFGRSTITASEDLAKEMVPIYRFIQKKLSEYKTSRTINLSTQSNTEEIKKDEELLDKDKYVNTEEIKLPEIKNTNTLSESKKGIVYITVIFVFLILFALFASCSTTKNSESKSNTIIKEIEDTPKSNTKEYKDDFVKFHYNPDVITNIPIDSPNAQYLLVTKLCDDTTESDSESKYSLITKNTILLVCVLSSENSASASDGLNINYKEAFSSFLSGFTGYEEISNEDISKDSLNQIKLNKTLQNGNQLKAKVLSSQKDGCAFAICNLLPSTKEEDKQAIIDVFNDISYLKLSTNSDNSNLSYTNSYFNKKVQ